MAVEEIIEATILGIEHETNGWVKIKTDAGDFSTKFPEPIAEAQQNIGQRGVIAFEMGQASQGRNGQWYPAARYFKRISTGYQPPFAGQQQPQQQPPMHPSVQAFQDRMQQTAPQQQPVQQQPSSDQRETRIMRQTAGKLAVATMPLVPSEQRTFQNQIALAEAWVRYFVSGPPQQQQEQQQAQPQPTQEQQMAAMAGQDDDIPF